MPDDDDDRPQKAPAVASTRMLGFFTGIITALVGINTLAVSCSNDKLARAATQRQQVESEEKYWRDAFKDLDDIQGSSLDVKQKQQRIDILVSITTLRASKVEQIAQGGQADAYSVVKELIKQFTAYVSNLPPGLRDSAANAAFAATQSSANMAAAPEMRGSDDVPVNAMAAPGARQNLLQLTPTSPDRWDVDVFWCDSTLESIADGNYATAFLLGNRLKDLANQSLTFGDSQRLGRVRIRVLPIARQYPGSGYPGAGTGLQIRYDNGAGEQALAGALKASLETGAAPPRSFTLVQSRTPTPWYLSVFVCGGSPPSRAGTVPGALSQPSQPLVGAPPAAE